MQVFTGEPGAEHRETLASASHAAAAGGVTTIVTMPDTDPGDRRRGAGRFRPAPRPRHRARQRPPDGGHDQGPRRRGDDRDRAVESRRRGCLHRRRQERHQRASDAPRADLCARFRRPDRPPDRGRRPRRRRRHERGRGTRPGSACRASRARPPRPSCSSATCAWPRSPAARYHAAKISTAARASTIARAKARRLPVTCGVSINHLTLNENDIGPYRTFFKLSPPLRTEQDRRALVAAAGRRHHRRHRLQPRSRRTSTPSARPSPRPPTAPSAWRRCCRWRCASTTAATSPLLRLIEVLSTTRRACSALPGGTLKNGAPADLGRGRSRRAVGRRPRPGCAPAPRTPALRRAQIAGPGLAHPGCGPHQYSDGLNTPFEGRMEFMTDPAERLADRDASALLARRWPSATCWARSRSACCSRAPPASATCAGSARATSAPPTCCAPATRGSPPSPSSSTR